VCVTEREGGLGSGGEVEGGREGGKDLVGRERERERGDKIRVVNFDHV
jgi:hypothetical protein